jgi:hypothetical protein
MEQVQRCESPDDARKIKRKIMGLIDKRETVSQVADLEEALIKILGRKSPEAAAPQARLAAPAAPPRAADFSAIKDPKLRETFEKAVRASELLQQQMQAGMAKEAELVKSVEEGMEALRQGAIAEVRATASEIYRAPRWFPLQWNLRRIARIAVLLVAVDFFIGKVLEKLLDEKSKPVLERLHFSQSDALVTGGVMLFLFVLSALVEKWIDVRFLPSYKRLLRKLVADRVTAYWDIYNRLLTKYAACQAQIAKLKPGSQASGEIVQAAKSQQVP